jgi:muramoyltetrapeptide carboxypeptidase
VNASATHPPALRRGDRIGIIAPASCIDSAMLEAGCNALISLGYEPVYSPSILDRDLYFAGSLERRVHEFHEMWQRKDVRAIICARGGYGTNYLLDRIDLEMVKQVPKIFMGYSDVTTLLTWFADQGLVTFHGPMVTKDFGSGLVDLPSFSAATSGEGFAISLAASAVEVLVPGVAEGILYGGCLSMLVASLGTPYSAQTEGKLLLLEDVAAKPYQIDRMLMHLKLAGKLHDVKGIIFGEMLDCVQPGGQSYTLQHIVLRVLGDLRIPIVYGLPSGHVSKPNITLPLGARAKLHASPEGSIEIEAAATR